MNKDIKSPIPLDKAQLTSTEVDSVDPWPKSISAEQKRHGMKELFKGEFSINLYESEPATLIFKDFPFDEIVHILSGTAILTDITGNSKTFNVGDSFIVPKGFTGLWELKGEYREMFIMETESMNKGFAKLGLG